MIGFRPPGKALEPRSANVDGGNYGVQPLHLAAGDGNLGEVRRLLRDGADPNLREAVFGRTALHWAAISGSGTTVHELIAAGARVDELDRSGVTPLQAAIRAHGRVTLALVTLLATGADVNAEQLLGDWRFTALLDAVLSPHLDAWKAITLLRRFGANANLIVRANHHQSLLHVAVTVQAKDRRNMASRALLQPIEGANSADARVRDSAGQTPLHWAARDDAALSTTLMEFGADANARDSQGQTPLHMALIHNADAVVVKTLVEHGASATSRDANGLTPLEIAKINKSAILVHLLEGQANSILAEAG